MQRVEEALEAIGGSILPNLSHLLDGVIDSATLARPGIDAAGHAEALRNTAHDVAGLADLVAAVTALSQEPPEASEPRRMSA